MKLTLITLCTIIPAILATPLAAAEPDANPESAPGGNSYGNYGKYGDYGNYPPPRAGYGNYGKYGDYGHYKREATK